MKYSNKKAYDKFRKTMAQELKLMYASGMSKEDVEEILKFTMQQFKKERKYQKSIASLDLYIQDMYEEGQNPLYNYEIMVKEVDFSKYTYWGWLQELDNEELLKKIQGLSKKEKIILSEIVIYNQSIRSVAKKIGLTRQRVYKSYKKIIDKLKYRNKT